MEGAERRNRTVHGENRAEDGTVHGGAVQGNWTVPGEAGQRDKTVNGEAAQGYWTVREWVREKRLDSLWKRKVKV